MKEEIEGIWYLPSNPKKEIHGKLFYSFGSGIELKIIGSFSDDAIPKHERYEIINGFAVNGKKITLIDCFASNHSLHASGIEKYTFLAKQLIIGANYLKNPDKIFKKVKIHLNGIEDWLDLQLIKVTHKYEKNSIKYEYTLPEVSEYVIDEKTKLSIAHNYSAQMGNSTNKIKFNSVAYFILDSDDSISISDVAILVHKLRLLLTFFTLKPFYVDEIEILSPIKESLPDGREYNSWLKLYYYQMIENQQKAIIEEDHFSFLKYIMPYPQIRPFFGTIVKGWFQKYELLSPILAYYFSNYYLPSTVVEYSFLHVIQAFEAFHRRTRKNEVLSKQEYGDKIKSVIDSVEECYKGWLKEKLSFANEPSFKERLIDLFSESDSLGFGEIFCKREDLVKKIRDTRNYYTHYDISLKEKCLDFSEMNKVTAQIEEFLLFLIIKEIGLDEINIRQIVENARHVNLINRII